MSSNVTNVSVLTKVRGFISRFSQRWQLIFKIAFKFFAYFFLFYFISHLSVFEAVGGAGTFNSVPVQAVLAFIAALLPNRAGILVAMLLVDYNIFKTSAIGAVLVGLMLLVIYICSANLFPEQTFLLALVPICIYYRWYLIVPVFCGMYLGVISVVPVVLGVLVYGVMEVIPIFTGLQSSMAALGSLPQLIQDASSSGFDQITHNDQLMFLLVVSAVVIVVGAVIRYFKFTYSRYISVGASWLIGFILLIYGISADRLSGSMGVTVLLALCTLGMAMLVEMSRVSVNHKEAQRLQFEDDNYLYDVKMFPKIRDKKEEEHERRPQGAQEEHRHRTVHDIEEGPRHDRERRPAERRERQAISETAAESAMDKPDERARQEARRKVREAEEDLSAKTMVVPAREKSPEPSPESDEEVADLFEEFDKQNEEKKE